MSFDIIKKHAQRGKIRTVKDGTRIMVEEADLEIYLASETLKEALGEAEGKPAAQVARDLGNTIANMPQSVRDAILNGMPQTGPRGKAGGPAEFLKATAHLDMTKVVDNFPDDPHHGFAVGYIHDSSPQWQRANTSTWILGDASYSWNGFEWEPGGSAKPIDADVSPASPFAELRPIVHSKAVPAGVKRTS